MNGRYAISKAGKDAGKIYIIVGCENGTLLLADGVERKLANPKKKNPKHVEIPKQAEPKEVAGMIAGRQRGCDEAIRQILHHMKKNSF